MLSIVIALGSAAFTGLQWQSSREAMQRQLRAYVLPVIDDGIEQDNRNGEGYLGFRVAFKNYGQTPAREFHESIGATVTRRGYLGPWPKPENTLPFEAVVPPGGTVHATVGGGDFQPSQFSAADFLYIFGRITYRDVFGEKHWAMFCLVSVAPIIILVRDNAFEDRSFTRCSVDNRDGDYPFSLHRFNLLNH